MRDNIFWAISMVVSFGINCILFVGGLIPPADTLRREVLAMFIMIFVVAILTMAAITSIRNAIHRNARRKSRIDRMFYDFEKLRR